MTELTEFEKAVRTIACHDFASQGYPNDEEVKEMCKNLIALLDLPTWKFQNRPFTRDRYEIHGNTLYFNNRYIHLNELEKLPEDHEKRAGRE